MNLLIIGATGRTGRLVTAQAIDRGHSVTALVRTPWGAFAGTYLEHKLRDRGVETVVLTGIATNMGVESTLRQGTGLGFAFVTVEDACSTFSRELQDFAFSTIFPLLSKVRTTQQVLEAIG